MDGVPNSCFGIIERIYRKTLMMESFFKDFTISGFVQNFPIFIEKKKNCSEQLPMVASANSIHKIHGSYLIIFSKFVTFC